MGIYIGLLRAEKDTMDKQKILFIGNHFHDKRVWEEIPEKLKNDGHFIITTSAHKCRVVRILDMLFTTFSRKDSYNLAVIDVFSGWSYIWAKSISTVLIWMNKPFILVLRGGGLPEFSQKYPHQITNLLGSANLVVTPSRWIASTLSSSRQKIHYLPNGLQINFYPFTLRKNLYPRLCWLRAFHSIYQPWMAIEVLADIKKIFPTADLLMIGPDKHDGSFEKTKETIKKYGLENSVRIIEGVKKAEVPDWLNQGDIFLNTTIYESFGVSVIEAAACGLPVVTTNVGELPYLWRHGEDALLVPPDDPAAMAAAVLRLLDEPGLAEKLSRNGRLKAEQLDWASILPQWEALLDTVAKND